MVDSASEMAEAAAQNNDREERGAKGRHILKTIAKYALIGAAILGVLFAAGPVLLAAAGVKGGVAAGGLWSLLAAPAAMLFPGTAKALAGKAVSATSDWAISWGTTGALTGLAIGAVAGLVQGASTADAKVEDMREEQFERLTRAQDRQQRLLAFRSKEIEQRALREQFERDHGLSPSLGGGRGMTGQGLVIG